MKNWIFTLGLLMSISMQTAEAYGYFTPSSSVIQLPASIPVANNTANGSIIWKSNVVKSDLRHDGAGGGGIVENYSKIFARVMNATASNKDIYATNLPGVGVRWKATWTAPDFPSGSTMSITRPEENASTYTGRLGNNAYVQTIWIELVKTGDISTGNLSIGTSVSVDFFCYLRCNSWDVRTSGNPTVSSTPVCSATSEPPNVPMPTWILGGDHVASQTAGFNIVLSCIGGGGAIRPLVTLTDANQRSNTSNILSLSSLAGTATGIGIQILHNGQPVTLGPENGTAQWEAGTINPGTLTYRIPLEARYVKTGSAVSAGPANGRATFTLDYQ